MPVSKERQKRYAGGSFNSKEWRDFRKWVKWRSGNRCEGSPVYPHCRAVNGTPHPATGSKVVLTVAHLLHNPSLNGPDDVLHLCQRCHLTYDAPHKAQQRKIRRYNANRIKCAEIRAELLE